MLIRIVATTYTNKDKMELVTWKHTKIHAKLFIKNAIIFSMTWCWFLYYQLSENFFSCTTNVMVWRFELLI